MQVQFLDGIFYVTVLIMSIVIHEVAHGYSAYLLGDDTARLKGRLTLNPFKHLDPFGSVILPLLLFISTSGSFLIGWAKPVPYNPNNLSKGRLGNMIVAFAGIFMNLMIAVSFGLLIRFATSFGLPPYNPDPLLLHPFYRISTIIVMMNLVLALFNIIPIPPLDGSKILFSFLPTKFRYIENFLEKWGMFLLLFFILFLWSAVSPIIFIAFSFITGLF
ncbi:MAG: site-2 protease family protein [Candidatus Pacebacteria bacterium]|nr:site-2 protease family protein [Candidatus Paceibacterota bacterium]